MAVDYDDGLAVCFVLSGTEPGRKNDGSVDGDSHGSGGGDQLTD